jgi:hypothetical protein
VERRVGSMFADCSLQNRTAVIPAQQTEHNVAPWD